MSWPQPPTSLHRENPYQTLFHQHINPTIFCPFGSPAYAHTITSSWHVTFDETATISTCDLAPWNIPTVEGQCEGLLLRQCKVEHEDLEE
ncbi:hypothetical protein PAXRUDRAFT_150432 [Paxillus rubicundulus Ve08.2h10]|uniref:Uncharacterized protein n=1 Tax=Paxillus rubicundulus Ve08.2h10 TaxID=930991 RepID=A0A0D0DXH2_9AGAM|nr:hypothetical protein PAXRUDRAFT_150432 [Paxillus rubicundulus Ve08.2h10]